jgi:hypothetical protein
MKKTRFKPRENQFGDYVVLAVSTTMADYKLAFELNKTLEINLAKKQDIPVYIRSDQPDMFPFFAYENDEQTEFFLIEDRTAGDPMVKSFLFFIRGHLSEMDEAKLPEKIGGIDEIFNCNTIALANQKSKKGKAAQKIKLIQCIFADLEYHLLEISSKQEEQKVKLKPTRNKSIRKLYN